MQAIPNRRLLEKRSDADPTKWLAWYDLPEKSWAKHFIRICRTYPKSTFRVVLVQTLITVLTSSENNGYGNENEFPLYPNGTVKTLNKVHNLWRNSGRRTTKLKNLRVIATH